MPDTLAPHDGELKFHETARTMAVEYVRGYGRRLLRESVEAAKARRHPLVQKADVQYAARRLRAAGRNRKDVFQGFLGAGLVGVFVQGFTAEMLASEPEPWIAVFYVVIGFMGIFAVFWSLIR